MAFVLNLISIKETKIDAEKAQLKKIQNEVDESVKKLDILKQFGEKQAQANLDKVAADLAKIKLEVVIAVGNTDSVGTDAYNMALGQRRAQSVKAYLISKGVDGGRIYTESKGKSNPVATNATAEGRAKNRRTDIEVVGTVALK
jgi:OOP family OmpA-OmpF porin